MSWRKVVLRILTLCVSLAATHAADVSDYLIEKGRHYLQVGPSQAYLDTENMYRFNVVVDNVTTTSIRAARVINPRGATINALPDQDGSPWRIRVRYDYQFDLENNFPNGAYTLAILGATDGERNLNFNIVGDQYPNIPILNDYEAAQAIPVAAYKQFTWQPFAGGTVNDFIQFSIEDENGGSIFETPDFGEEGALTGLSTSCILEPSILRSGRLYIGRIKFVKVLQSGHPAYPGVPGYAGYFVRSEFPLRTVAGPTRGLIDTLQIWKTRRYEYSRLGDLDDDNDPWHFAMRGEALGPGFVWGGKLIMPSPAGERTLTVDETQQDFEYVFAESVDRVALDAAYPHGRYTIVLTNGASREERQFDYPAGTYPPAPEIQNVEELFDVPRAQHDLVIRWAPWAGASDRDFIRVDVEDLAGVEYFDTPSYTRDDRLRGTATQTVIPAGTLLPGQTYEVTVTFYRLTTLDFNTAPGGLIYGGVATRSALTFAMEPPDVLSAAVRLGRRAWQRSASVFEPDPTRPADFSAQTVGRNADAVTTASVRTPAGEVFALPDTGVTNLFSISEGSYAALTSRFTIGNYLFNTQSTPDGARNFALQLRAIEPPPQPVIRNLRDLQQTIPNRPNAIQWTPWAGANANTDYVFVSVEDSAGRALFSTPQVGSDLAFRGTTNQVEIPSGRLQQNQTYNVRVRFERMLQGVSLEYPGVTLKEALFSETVFHMSTLVRTNFVITNVALASGNLEFRATAPLPNRLYRIDSSADLLNWTPGPTYTSAFLTNIPVRLDVPSQFFILNLVP